MGREERMVKGDYAEREEFLCEDQEVSCGS